MKITYSCKYLCVLILFFCVLSPPVIFGNSSDDPAVNVDAMQLTASMQEALNIEAKTITKLDLQLVEEEIFSETLLLEFSAFRLKFSTHANLIIMPETSVKNLEKASNDHILALNKIRARIQDINLRAKQVDDLIETTLEQVNINEKQLKALDAEKEKSPEVKRLIAGYRKLLKKISAKQKLLLNLRERYRSVVANIVSVEEDFQHLSEKFDEVIQARKREDLFQRNVFPMLNTGKTLIDDSGKLFMQFLPILSVPFWLKSIEFIKTAGSFNVISFFGLYSVVLLLFLRLKYLLGFHKKNEQFNTFWITLTIRMLDKTIFLLATVVFLFVFSQSGFFSSRNPLILTVLNLLSVWLFTKWFLILLDQWAMANKGALFVHIVLKIRILIYISRVFAMLCVLGNWIYIDPNIVFIAVRLLFLSILYAWLLWFWRHYYNYALLLNAGQENKKAVTVAAVKYLIYGVLSVGFIADLAGFGTFAFFWLTSWARTSVVILWSLLVFLSARELSRIQGTPLSYPQDDDSGKRIHIHWFASKIGLIILAVFAFISLVFAWGGKQAVLTNIYNVLDKPLSIGNWEISILHIAFAVIALFITNAIAVAWRQFFKEVILKESGIDIGVQDSVSTISYYIIWFIGILASLNLFGVSMKSVTLIFGALGLGLGFGLQTIFNNFISGIILLFERPIQVGDELEIDGVWATVRKINVRSTVVQTYDNATLIIPNSEFVSSKVINWSFKDKRIRRTIQVGVAYGSDIERVKKILLEAANTTSRVLKHPKPDVHFTDFGDSALVFILRVWTRVDSFMAVETEVRFKIDRLFRENNIEISFPQRDIHIRSSVEKDGQ